MHACDTLSWLIDTSQKQLSAVPMIKLACISLSLANTTDDKRCQCAGGNANGTYSSAAPPAERGAQPADRLRLEHAPAVAPGADAEGPFDVCIADISFSRVLHALLQARSETELLCMLFSRLPSQLSTAMHPPSFFFWFAVCIA